MTDLIVAEPPSAYADRPPLVVDASVIAAAVFHEAGRDAALAWMRGRRLCAPHLMDSEMASVALRKIASGYLGREIAATLLAGYTAAEIERHPVDAGAVLELALRTGLTAYDAGYLCLARTLGAPLATFDAKLGTAALRELRGA